MKYFFTILLLMYSFAFSQVNPVPTTIEDVFLPGSQPGQSGNLEHPSKCDNCHGGYDQAVEPAFNWRGSMMAQAARDPLFYACLAIANQDAPESGDLCIRCHSPAGWLEGRSTPTDGSALNNNDREGVQCDFCHKAIKPSPVGVNPYPDDVDYTGSTYAADQQYLATLSHIPEASANGMYIADNSNDKRGPFVDAEARHKMLYSPFHEEANICGTCHDVSNPVYSWNADLGIYEPNDFGALAPDFDSRQLFPIERTFSEWMMSEFNTPDGVIGTAFGGNKTAVATCQDCHMMDVTGVACNKKGAIVRDNLPLHDMTGGNTFILLMIDQAFPGEANTAALNAGIQRAEFMLQNATTLELNVDQYDVNIKVTNETGHKLPSGYPEGRRIWINVKAYNDLGDMFFESGAYDLETAILEKYDTYGGESKIYEIKPGIGVNIASVVNLPDGPSFHFVLNNEIFFDNRIPPRGFTNANFEAIQSPPVGYTYTDGQYWDETTYTLDEMPARVEVKLYYQTVSKEYIDFLDEENRTNHWGATLKSLWEANGMSPPVVMNSASWGNISDTEPPTVPTNLNAQARSSSEIELTWTASTDNIGIAGYYIYRDGAEIATSATSGYLDTGLDAQTTYSYEVSAFDEAGNVSANSNTASATTRKQKGGGRPRSTELVVSGANPFNPTTQFTYYLENPGLVSIDIFTIRGQKIATLVKEWKDKGEHLITWDASLLPSGTYFVIMTSKDFSQTRKVILLK